MRTPRRAGLLGRLGGLLREDLGLEVKLVVVRLSARGTRRGNGRERVEGVSCFSGATVTIFAKTRDM